METVLLTLAASGTAGTAATVFTLGDALLLGSTLLSAGGAIGQGRAAADAGEFNARLAENEGIRERQIAQRDAEDLARRRSAVRASNRAIRFGAGGVTEAGSTLLAEDAFIEQTALDVESTRIAGVARATALQNEAALSRVRGKTAQTQGFVKAGASLLTGARKVFG